MLGKKIRQLRNDLHLTQEELGAKIGVSASTIGMYEQGRRSPDNEKILILANLFGVTTDYLLGNDDTPQQDEKSKSADDELAENVIIYHRNGGVVKRTFSKEDMELLTKMIEKLGQNKYDGI